jgi:ribonuclease Z
LNFEIRWTYLQGSKRIPLFEDSLKSAYAFPLTHRISTYGFNIREQSGLRVFKTELWPGLLPPYEAIKRLKAGDDVVMPDGSTLESGTFTDAPQPARSYCYCSDTIYEPAILSHIQSCDLLYHEATYTDIYQDKAKANFHSTAREAGRMAHKANVKKLIIGHFSSRYKVLDDLLIEAKEEFEATELAEEGRWYSV